MVKIVLSTAYTIKMTEDVLLLRDIDVSRVPWGYGPSLKEKTDEAGIDFDSFIDGLKNDLSDQEMAQRFNVSAKTIADLRDHFMTRGLDSVMGQD